MKKKFLSLMMAAAVVATTSVSAFAADSSKTYNIGDTEQEHQVTVTGNITNTEGQVVQGTISVTVPTAITFTVNKEGKIDAPPITITNNSTEKVEVVASEFVDTSENSKITVVTTQNLDSAVNSDSNKNVSLTLTGNGGSVALASTNRTKTGLYDLNGGEIQKGTTQPLGVAYKDNDLTLNLTGEAKKEDGNYRAPAKPIQDKFTLTLKIKKASKAV